MKPIALRVIQDSGGKAPFASWFHALERSARSKVSAALFQMEEGNFSDSKYLSKGIWERRIHSGPGYRVYFAKHGRDVLILLGGGTKRTQALDIRRVQELWADYAHSENEG